MDQAPQQLSSLGGDDLFLPRFELDDAEVLQSRSMLGEQTWPVFPIRVNLHAALPGDNAGSHPVGAPDLPNCVLALFDDVRIALVKGYAQLVHGPSAFRQTPVSEVHAKEVGVPGPGKGHAV